MRKACQLKIFGETYTNTTLTVTEHLTRSNLKEEGFIQRTVERDTVAQ